MMWRQERGLMALVLALALLLGVALGGCSGAREGGYYVLRENLERQGADAGALLTAESVSLAAAPDPVSGLLSAFAAQPGSHSLRSALPEEVDILGCEVENGEAVVTLSPNYAELSPMDQTVLCCALAGTLSQLEEIRSVAILVDGETVVRGLTADDALLLDGEADPEERQARLYFTDSDGRYLTAEVHRLSLGEDTSLERIVLEELLRGPFGDDLRTAVPAGTAVRSVATEDGLCTVDLSGEFVSARSGSAQGQRLAVYAIVNTLTALPEVERVRILSEGEAVTAYEYLDLERSFAENERVLGPADTAGGEVDITIYMALRDRNALVGVPWIVRPEGESLAQAACAALFSAGEDPDYRSLFYGEDSFLAVEVTDSGVCRVDLPRSFFDSRGSEEEIRLAVEALTATLAGLPGITGVYLTMDGAPAKYGGLDFSGRLIPNIESIVK